jgi:ribosome biogenesis protein SSF1/2
LIPLTGLSYNRTKDYASIASQFGITHLLAFSETKSNIILRIARFYNGPTLHFRIPQYCLTKHVRATQKRPFDSSAAFLTPPLIVLNNFGSEESEHLTLLRVTLQHMFPSINVNTVRLNECRRVVLFHYKKETQTVEMRHYAIRATPVGINRNIKKILQTKIPNLGNLKVIVLRRGEHLTRS